MSQTRNDFDQTLVEVSDLSPSFIHNESESFGARMEYNEMKTIPVRQVSELELLRERTQALLDQHNRFKFLLKEIHFLIKTP